MQLSQWMSADSRVGDYIPAAIELRQLKASPKEKDNG